MLGRGLRPLRPAHPRQDGGAPAAARRATATPPSPGDRLTRWPPRRQAAHRRARHRLVQGRRADLHRRRRRAAARARHRPARKPRGQARLCHRHGSDRGRGPRGGRAGRADRRASTSTTSGPASAPAGWSATSPRSRSSLAATRSSRPTSTNCSRPAATRSTARAGRAPRAARAVHARRGRGGQAPARAPRRPARRRHPRRRGRGRRRCATSIMCIRSAHLGVKSIVASPIAAAMACLTEEERELGVALVELGAGVTNVSLFAGGMLVGLPSIPIGAKDITDDIACAFGIAAPQAERMKCFHGSAMTSPRDNHEMIEVDADRRPRTAPSRPRITRAQLIDGHPPAARAADRRDRRGAEGARFRRPGRAAGGADRRRRRAEGHRRLCAGRARPRGPGRPAARR